MSRPSSSTPCISYWVTSGASEGSWPLSGFRWTGRCSVSGSRVITTAAAWIPSCLLRFSRPLGDVYDPPRLGVLVVHRTQVGRGDVPVLVTLFALEARVQRSVTPHHERWHCLCDPVADDVGVTEDPGRVAHGGARLYRREGDDLSHVVGAVLLGRVADHLAPVALVEVHVDVGHLLAAGVEETLEQKVVADRVEIDDSAGSTRRSIRQPSPVPDRPGSLSTWRSRSGHRRPGNMPRTPSS